MPSVCNLNLHELFVCVLVLCIDSTTSSGSAPFGAQVVGVEVTVLYSRH